MQDKVLANYSENEDLTDTKQLNYSRSSLGRSKDSQRKVTRSAEDTVQIGLIYFI